MSKKTLIIAEKPSVAADIARALGGFTKQQDYFENDDYVLSSAVGHLLEMHEPEEYEVKRGKWSFAHLPVIPPHFALRPIEQGREPPQAAHQADQAQGRRRADQRLRRRARGRADLPLHRPARRGRSKPIQRLWLQSMTPAAIRDGFASLRSRRARCSRLADAARCRSEADWLVGINGTRAMTAFNSQATAASS